MLRSDFEQAIGRALTDAQFCARLVTDPVDALTDYGLGPHEAHWLEQVQGASLADLIAQVVTVGAKIWGIEFCALLRELHGRLPTKHPIHMAGLLPIADVNERGAFPELLWPEGVAGLN